MERRRLDENHHARPQKMPRVEDEQEAPPPPPPREVAPAALTLTPDNWRDVLEHLDVLDVARLAKTCVFLRSVAVKDGKVAAAHLEIRESFAYGTDSAEGPYDVVQSRQPDILLAVHPAAVKSVDIRFVGSRDRKGELLEDEFSTVFPMFIVALASFRGVERLTLNVHAFASCRFKDVGANIKRFGDVLASLPMLRELVIENRSNVSHRGSFYDGVSHYNAAFMAAITRTIRQDNLHTLSLDVGSKPGCQEAKYEYDDESFAVSSQTEQTTVMLVRSVFGANNLSNVSLNVCGHLLGEFCDQAKLCSGAKLPNLKDFELHLHDDDDHESFLDFGDVNPNQIEHLLSFVERCDQIEHLSIMLGLLLGRGTVGLYLEKLQCIFHSLSALRSVHFSGSQSCEAYGIGSFLAEQAIQNHWEHFSACGIYLRPAVAKKLQQEQFDLESHAEHGAEYKDCFDVESNY